METRHRFLLPFEDHILRVDLLTHVFVFLFLVFVIREDIGDFWKCTELYA